MSIKYFSMFSGIGGFEHGLEKSNADFECVGYSEIDKHAVKTYETHYNHINYGDATKIAPADIPDFNLLVGGFPCQAFSIAGKRLGFNDTRGTLFFDIVRILQHHTPQNFILENVKGLLSHDKGNTFFTIIKTLTEIGYSVQWSLLNSKDHGTPQNRERVYIVGHFGRIPEQEVFPSARPCNPYTTIGKSTKTAIARTLTAGGNSGGNHSGMTILRTPQGDRRLTVTELERLQGFPDAWTVGSDSQRYKQLGNAVTTNVVQYIANRMYN